MCCYCRILHGTAFRCFLSQTDILTAILKFSNRSTYKIKVTQIKPP
jgi:hypothetical protein